MFNSHKLININMKQFKLLNSDKFKENITHINKFADIIQNVNLFIESLMLKINLIYKCFVEIIHF
jgi:hypothetical protein